MGLVMAPDNPVLDSNLARVGLEQGGQATNGRAFSCAIGPKSEKRPCRDFEGDVMDRSDRAI